MIFKRRQTERGMREIQCSCGEWNQFMSSNAQHQLCSGEGSRESSFVNSFSCIGYFVLSSLHICIWLCCCYMKLISLSCYCRLTVTKLHLDLKHKGRGKTRNYTIVFLRFLVEWQSCSASVFPEEAIRNPAENLKPKYSSISLTPSIIYLSTCLKEQQTYHTFWMRSTWPRRGTRYFLKFSVSNCLASREKQGQICQVTWLFLWRR